MAEGSSSIENRSMPPGPIISELGYDDLDAAVARLRTAFRLRERLRIGAHRAQLVLGAGAIVAAQHAERGQAFAPGAHSHALMVRVNDVDQHWAQTSERGARIISPPADYPYGERQYSAEDLAGHRWVFSQSLADADPRSWGGAPREAFE